MRQFKIGDCVRCIEDDCGNIEPGTRLTIKWVHSDSYAFNENENSLWFHEVKLTQRTIKEVREGDVIISSGGEEGKVQAVGESGFAVKLDDLEAVLWFAFDEEDTVLLKIKGQPETPKKIDKLWTAPDWPEVDDLTKKVNELVIGFNNLVDGKFN